MGAWRHSDKVTAASVLPVECVDKHGQHICVYNLGQNKTYEAA